MALNTGSLADIYHRYISSIVAGDLDSMAEFVAEDVVHNGNLLGLEGYKSLLKRNIVATKMGIQIKRLIADERHVAALLVFTTSEATQDLIGYRLDGQIFSYAENVIYDFDENRRIKEVHSVVDTDTIRAHARA